MAVITEIPPEKKKLFPVYVEKWTKIGLNTDTMKRDKVADDLKAVYKAADLKAPDKVIFLSSPMAAVFMLEIMDKDPDFDPLKYDDLSLEWLEKEFEKHKTEQRLDYFPCYGQFDSPWLSFYDFFLTEFDLECCKKLKGLISMACNTGWFFPFDDFVVVTNRPSQIHLDEQGRLHNEVGKAIEYRDGWGVYSWHGVRVRPYVIEEPGKITVEDIEKEENQEVRRVKITQYGVDRYILNSGAEKVHEDEWGILYKKEVINDEPITMVKVVNSSPEPDGTFKDYFLRVPPSITTAREAVAWTFDVPEEEYELEQES